MAPSPDVIPVALRAVTKRFGGVLACDAVSLDIRAGEVHVLLGENGAGKSTLIAMLAGMRRPDSGDILVAGTQTAIASPGHALSLGIGTVFQHTMLARGLTVADNLLLGGQWWQRPRRRALRARFDQACAAFGIDATLDAVVGDLSLGERQQIEILRALWRGGRVVVLDEPTAMLTPRGIGELGALLRRLAADGLGIVFVTHKLGEALAYGDRITVLRRGRVVDEIGPEQKRSLSDAAATRRIVAMMFGPAEAGPMSHHIPPPQAAAGPDVLEVEDLSVAGQLAGVSFGVRAGEILGIAGIDGNGQKTLAEALSGQIRAGGRIRLGGRDVGRLGVGARRREGLRYVTDDRLGEGIIGSFPLALNLLLKQVGETPFWRSGLPRAAVIADHARALVRRFDIRTPSVAAPIGVLSGGNIQKAILARELTGGARAVIYSKPTQGLDVRATAAVRARIREQAASGVATVLISTDLDELLELAGRIGVMNRRRLAGVVANGVGARDAVGRLMAGVGQAH